MKNLLKKIYNARVNFFLFIWWLIKELFFGKNIINNPQQAGLWVYFISLSIFYGLGIYINVTYFPNMEMTPPPETSGWADEIEARLKLLPDIDDIPMRLEKITKIVAEEPDLERKSLMYHYITYHGTIAANTMDEDTMMQHLNQLEKAIDKIKTK